jgi:hypothetical protein
MGTNTVYGYPSQAQEVSATPEPVKPFSNLQVTVLGFEHWTRPGSSFKGNATIAVTGIIPGHTLILAQVKYFGPREPDNPDDHGSCSFPQYKVDFKDKDENWKPQVSIFGETPDDKSLHFRILTRARIAIELYLKQHESPTQAFDDLPQDIAVTDIGDEQIPF